MVWLTYVGCTGDRIRVMEVVELMRCRSFDWLDLGGKSTRGLAWSSS